MKLYLLLIAHFFADFVCQSASLAQKKKKKFWFLLLHAAIYATVFVLAFRASTPLKNAWFPFCIISISHFVIDYIRVIFDKKQTDYTSPFVSFLVDQALHILIICVLVEWLGLNALNTQFFLGLAAKYPLDQLLRWILLILVILQPSSVFNKKLILYSAGRRESDGSNKPQTGSIIGMLERIIISILVAKGAYEAIGFVLAAKSIARHSEFDRDPKFGEVYLIGTLTSTIIAVALPLLLKITF